VGSKESAVKKYIVTLSDAEREKLNALIHSGKHPAQKLLKARILFSNGSRDGGQFVSDIDAVGCLRSLMGQETAASL
jgi:hypothetical protein